MQNKKLALVSALVLMTYGCSSQPKNAAVDMQPEATPAPTEVAPAAQADATEANPLEDGMLAKRVIYFDFDSHQIKDEFNAVIEAHAKFLAENPNKSITLEGHADERGTRDYNVALGDRRASSVKQFFLMMGASDNQVATVSFGEEKPVKVGADEMSWSQNRRVEVVYADIAQ